MKTLIRMRANHSVQLAKKLNDCHSHWAQQASAQKQSHSFKTPKILNKCVLVCKHYQRVGPTVKAVNTDSCLISCSLNILLQKKNKYEDLLGYKVLTTYTCLNHKRLPHYLLKTQVFVYALVNPVKSETLSLWALSKCTHTAKRQK